MSSKIKPRLSLALIEANDHDWPKVFHKLRIEKSLSQAIRELNGLQASAEFSKQARETLEKIGMALPG